MNTSALNVVGSTLFDKGNTLRLLSSFSLSLFFLSGKLNVLSHETHEEKHVQTSECEIPCNVAS